VVKKSDTGIAHPHTVMVALQHKAITYLAVFGPGRYYLFLFPGIVEST